jgi:hypothetical protein
LRLQTDPYMMYVIYLRVECWYSCLITQSPCFSCNGNPNKLILHILDYYQVLLLIYQTKISLIILLSFLWSLLFSYIIACSSPIMMCSQLLKTTTTRGDNKIVTTNSCYYLGATWQHSRGSAGNIKSNKSKGWVLKVKYILRHYFIIPTCKYDGGCYCDDDKQQMICSLQDWLRQHSISPSLL